MKNKFRFGGIITFTVLLLITLSATLFLSGAADTIIIYYGVGTYRTISTVLKVLCGVFAVCDVGTAAIESRRYNIVMKEEAAAIAEREDRRILEDRAKRDEESVLSVSKRLSEETIRKELSDNLHGDWSICADGINMLIRQSEKMDDMQERLSDLLRKNGADKLGDAEDTLDRVEQGLLKNIRKVLNYMEIGSADRSSDLEKVRTSLEQCTGENEKLLENTSGFLIALTDYLNSQGDDDRDELSTLESFKDILIKSTKR